MQSRALPRQKAVLFLSKRMYSMFPPRISYVVVAQSSRRSPAMLEVVSSNPVEVEFFSFSFSYIRQPNGAGNFRRLAHVKRHLPNRSETSGSVS